MLAISWPHPAKPSQIRATPYLRIIFVIALTPPRLNLRPSATTAPQQPTQKNTMTTTQQIRVGTNVIERRFGVSQNERDAHQGPRETLLFTALPSVEYVVVALGAAGKNVKLRSAIHGDSWVPVKAVSGGQYASSRVGDTITLSGPYEIVTEATPTKDLEWHRKQRTEQEFRALKMRLAAQSDFS